MYGEFCDIYAPANENRKEVARITSITNIKTGQEVCGYYKHKSVNLNKCDICIGKPLRIVYSNDSYFTHFEAVIEITKNIDMIHIKTSKKAG